MKNLRHRGSAAPVHARVIHVLVATTLILALSLCCSFTIGQGQASAHMGDRRGNRGDARQHFGHGDSGSSARVAHRSSTWRHHHSYPKSPQPAPEESPSAPAPAPSPVPAPEESAPAPEPAPAPAPTPEPAPTPSPSPEPSQGPSPGKVIFNGNFDSGFRGWYVQSLSSRATLVTSGVFQGTQAARFEVRQGDVEPDTGSQRSEVSGPTFNEGEDLYIRDAIRVPAGNTYSAPWQIIEQLHEEDWSGSPGVALFLDNSHAIHLGAGDGSPTFWQGPTLEPGRWYELVYHVDLSQSSSTGFVEVWLDGVQQKMANGQTRIYGQTIQAAQTYLKADIYRSKSSTGTTVVEHDAIEVGTSYAAVTAG